MIEIPINLLFLVSIVGAIALIGVIGSDIVRMVRTKRTQFV